MKKTYLSVFFSAFLVLGILGIAMPHSAEAAKGVGYINIQQVFAAHPDMNTIKTTIKLEREKAQKEFDESGKDMSEKEKTEYANKLSQQLIEKEQSLLKPLRKKVLNAIEKVAQEKGIDSVVDASVMIFGGQDLTKDVINALE